MKIKTDAVELYCEVEGDGRPIVFSHGWREDSSIWDSQVKHFAKNYAVVAYDHRGHGKSDRPKVGEGHYSVQQLANDLYTLMRTLDLDKPILVGFSLGGYATILLALKHPDQISQLVLVGASAKLTLPTSVKIFRTLRFLLPYETYLRGECKYGGFYKPSQQIIDEAVARAINVDEAVASECWKELTENYDARDKVSTIQVPTLIVVGENDRVNLEASRYLNREIKGSELRIVPESGHWVMIEKPQEFNQLLEAFIR